MPTIPEEPAAGFTPYGLSHWAVLAGTAVGAVWLVRFGRRHRTTALGDAFTRGFAVVQFAVTFGFMAVWLTPPLFDLRQSLPLQLSDWLRVISAYALWSRRRWAVAITYYWGLTLNPQAMITPDLHPDVAPALEFASYWIQHVLVMWAAVYLTWGLTLRPSWRGYRTTLAVTVVWAVVVGTVNRVLGTNYGFLNAKPGGPSLLDLMGDWPWYLLVTFGLLAAAWALITWPWTRKARRPRGSLGPARRGG